VVDPKNPQGGFILVVVALLLVALAGFVALGVDVGALYSAKASAQEIADAAALAGAFTFISSPTSDQPQTAENHALAFALESTIMGHPIPEDDLTITVDVENRRVTVDLSSTQETHFAKAIGKSTVDIGVTATAEASEYSTGATKARPWFIANTVFSSDDICDAKCNPAQLLIDPASREVTSFAEAQFGNQFTLKPQGPNEALSPGQFYELDIPGLSGGANGYEDGIRDGAPDFSPCFESYSVMTGNKKGPTERGVNDLIGDPPRFTWVAPGRYRREADGKIFDMSENLVVAPIWDVCNSGGFCPTAKLHGSKPSVQVMGWGVLFVEGVSSDEEADGVIARLLNVSSCGTGSGAGTTGEERGSAVFGIPVRLVRP
jgi:Flp pilus assembly protein TadG